ncbi:MAG: hypothetical protein ABIP12_05585 [Terriglobales bacterium]
MTAHELAYYRYLLAEIKQLHTRNQAQSVMLDSPRRDNTDWRSGVEKMTQDPTFRSSVEANLEPHFTRIERGLTDAAALDGLLQRK